MDLPRHFLAGDQQRPATEIGLFRAACRLVLSSPFRPSPGLKIK
jgi:hypothetical protein